MDARQIMSSPVVTTEASTDLETVAKQMMAAKVGSIVVVDQKGDALGIITESDYLGHEVDLPFSSFTMPRLWGRWVGTEGVESIYAGARRTPAARIMRRPLVAVEEGTSADEVVRLMLHHRIKHIPVLRDGRPVGIVARHDLLRIMQQLAAHA